MDSDSLHYETDLLTYTLNFVHINISCFMLDYYTLINTSYDMMYGIMIHNIYSNVTLRYTSNKLLLYL